MGYTQKLWVYRNREANKKGKETFKLFLDTLLAENEKKEKKGHGTENVALILSENVFFARCKLFRWQVPFGEAQNGWRVMC